MSLLHHELPHGHMGGCQNYGPFSNPYHNTAPNILGSKNGTIILTTTHIHTKVVSCCCLYRLWLFSWSYLHTIRGITGITRVTKWLIVVISIPANSS